MTDTLSIKILDATKDGDDLLQLLDSGAVISLIVTGASMLPFLRDGRDIVLLQKTEQPKKGQILFFRRRNNAFVLHRIRKILPDGNFLVNGDAQTWCEIVVPQQVVAIVIGITRNGRTHSVNSIILRLRDALWYPTRPLRPMIFRTYSILKRLFTKQN